MFCVLAMEVRGIQLLTKIWLVKAMVFPRIKLVKDFIDEPMLVANFPHPLNCILECVLINIVGYTKLENKAAKQLLPPTRGQPLCGCRMQKHPSSTLPPHTI